MYWVYVIYNPGAKKTYIGETEDIDSRLRLYNSKSFKGSYTSRINGEWELIYKESYPNRIVARKREKQLKSYQGRQFLKKYIPV